MRQANAMAAFCVWRRSAAMQGQDGPYHAGPVIQIGGEVGDGTICLWDSAGRTGFYVATRTHVGP